MKTSVKKSILALTVMMVLGVHFYHKISGNNAGRKELPSSEYLYHSKEGRYPFDEIDYYYLSMEYTYPSGWAATVKKHSRVQVF